MVKGLGVSKIQGTWARYGTMFLVIMIIKWGIRCVVDIHERSAGRHNFVYAVMKNMRRRAVAHRAHFVKWEAVSVCYGL